MPVYRAPVDDMKFIINELLELETLKDIPQFDELTPDLVDDVLTNAAKFAEEVLQPLNQSGDEEGCHYENGVVRTPKGFKEAYKAYCDAGWGGLAAPVPFGGIGPADPHHHGDRGDGAIRQPVFCDVSGSYVGCLCGADDDRPGLDEVSTSCRRWCRANGRARCA